MSIARTQLRLLVPALAALAVLLFAASAQADYGQVGLFAQSGNGEQLQHSTGAAVNSTGAGGVEAGSVYTAGGNRVSRYNAKGEIKEVWGWETIASGPDESPTGGFERCRPANGDTCAAQLNAPPSEQEGVGRFAEPAGVAVDQSTGYVYVLNRALLLRREHNLIEVFSADGSEVIARFGDAPAAADTIETAPEKMSDPKSFAVGEGGKVYVSSQTSTGYPEERVMCFRPETPGDYEHYAYCGRSQDIKRGSESAQSIAVDDAGHLYVGGPNLENIKELSLAEPTNPTLLCTYVTQISGKGMTVNPLTGEVFYFAESPSKRGVHRLKPCDPQTHEFHEAQATMTVSPSTAKIKALAFNTSLTWGPNRPSGALYAASAEFTAEGTTYHGLGYIFAPAEVLPPTVESESVSNTRTTSSVLHAAIDPHGYATHYAFQYESEAQYEENEPNERQSLDVSATGGVYGLAFKGRRLGGEAVLDLKSGSSEATNLATVTATANLSAAVGSGETPGARATGTTISGSDTITAVSTTEGTLEVGQGIAGNGVPTGATILSLTPEGASGNEEVGISAPATGSAAHVSLATGTAKVNVLSTAQGAFAAGQVISGQGIVPGTTIASISGSELTLSAPATAPNPSVALQAGSKTLTALNPEIGSFAPGDPIRGEGIPAGTKVITAEGGELTISQPVTLPGNGVAISNPTAYPLAVGERIEGAGIPAGTRIVSLREEPTTTKLTLSNPAQATQAAVPVRAGIAFDASPAALRSALEGLSTIGPGNVAVTGGPGDATGSSPYEITFTRSLGNTDLPELSTDAFGLEGGSASATVQSEHDGGQGFDQGASEAPIGGGEIGSGSVGQVSAAVTGLQPGTAYRFRVVATSECNVETGEPCVAEGGAIPFSTYPLYAPGLPDHRAYEMVSPAQKHGGEVIPAEPNTASCGGNCKPNTYGNGVFPMQSTPDGEALSYVGQPFNPAEGAISYDSYIARRTESGWQTTALIPALPPGRVHQLAFDTSLQHGLLSVNAFGSEKPELEIQDTSDPGSTTSLETEPNHRSAGALVLSYAGHSTDFSRQFFAANDSLTEETPFAPEPPDPGASKNDLYEWHDGQLTVVNVLPGNTAVTAGAKFASISPDTHAVSEDGSRVFFKDEAGNLYLRESGEATRLIADPGHFLSASPDGSEVLLTDGCLYSVESEACTDLTEGQGGFLGLVGQSKDLSHLYFVDTKALGDGEANEAGEVGEAGKDNLYAWSGGEVQFIAQLTAKDNEGLDSNVNYLEDWTANPSDRTAEASPDGRFLAFASQASLTGYDNVGFCREDFNLGKGEYEPVEVPCNEAFLYDSATGKLACASCNPTGEAPIGNTTLRRIDGSPEGFPQPRYLTDEGRLYFDTQDSLSARDTDEGVEDVYEYSPQEAGAEGTCEREAGCIRLISAGTEPVDSNLIAVDETGRDVFFDTRDKLALKDKDELLDIYDAREGGGIAAESEIARAECQGENCQAPVSPPNDPTPASSSFEGAGNVKEAPVAKKHAKKKHAKKHKKKARKHAKKARTAKRNHGGAK